MCAGGGGWDHLTPANHQPDGAGPWLKTPYPSQHRHGQDRVVAMCRPAIKRPASAMGRQDLIRPAGTAASTAMSARRQRSNGKGGTSHEGCSRPSTAPAVCAPAAEIGEQHQLCLTRGEQFIEAALAAGQRLIEAKSLLSQGAFGRWLSSNIDNLSARTARRYMRAAVAKTVAAAELPISTRKTINRQKPEIDHRPTARLI